jgi:lysophospholipase L1-like esterase
MTLSKRMALAIAGRQMGRGQEMRRTQFAELVPLPGAVVMLGDSITEGGIWDEWFPERAVVNRGIGGETAEQVLARIDSAINAPTAVFLLIGTNDLVLRYAPQEIAANVSAILRRIHEVAPDAARYVQSIMPRGPRWRDSITITNSKLAVLAQQEGAEFLNLWPAMADHSGSLRTGFTLDGLHLTGMGYRAWCEVLEPHISASLTAAKPCHDKGL